MIFHHLWWWPTFHQRQADTVQHRVGPAISAVSSHVLHEAGHYGESAGAVCSLGTGFLDRAEKETKNDFSSLPPTLGSFSAEAKSWYSTTQGGFMEHPV